MTHKEKCIVEGCLVDELCNTCHKCQKHHDEEIQGKWKDMN